MYFHSKEVSGVSAINPLVASMEEIDKCYSFILSRTPHETDTTDTRLYYNRLTIYPILPLVYITVTTG
jgi:hypothetical protein